ncbi:MAG TPA: xanthine dehydrogenase family protein subunit M [Conexibacter sp.]|nr:xanthine dehydrogenase family protein subunit M [Conexibacter sp.]
MKPAPFEYRRVATAEEALAQLAEDGEDAKLLAGGQSLVPMLNFRLARPARLIDISRVGELAHVARRDGALRIGATTKQAVLERSALVAREWPLLHDAVLQVAHPQIRNAGTVGGSVAHADPAAELPVACVTLDATLHVRSARGARTLPAADFFVTHLTTAMEPDELLAEIEIPPLPARTGHAFVEFARRHGDFALGGAAALLTLDGDGACTRARLTLMTAAPVPWRAAAAEQRLVGSRLGDDDLREAVELAVAEIEPTGDIHGSTAYRTSLAGTMAQRALAQARTAAAQAGEGAR